VLRLSLVRDRRSNSGALRADAAVLTSCPRATLEQFLAAGKVCDTFGGERLEFHPPDKSSWSWSNLNQLGMKELSELEHHAPPEYESLVGSVMNLLPLGETTRNIKPFSRYLFPTDKYELTHSKGMSVTFQLDRTVFDSGTVVNRAEKLQLLEQAIFGAGDTVRRRYYTLTSSPLNSITLPDLARHAASIPNSAKFYSFCYPNVSDANEAFAPIRAKGVQEVDPFVQWLLSGAFVYYDHEFNIVAINS
jgi:hypothetical protein